MNEDILHELAKPFHPTAVTWKPGALAKGGGKALALAYADLRAYQNRLDEVCGLDWSVTYTPWGDRIICNLTIAGVTRSSTGEPDAQSERSEVAGTATEAQAYAALAQAMTRIAEVLEQQLEDAMLALGIPAQHQCGCAAVTEVSYPGDN